MVKRTTFAVLLCIMSLTMWAGERSDEDMRAIAMQHFATSRANTRGMALNTDVCELARRASYSVYGLQEGQGFVIVGRSTAFNPILATSETSFDANNLADAKHLPLQEPLHQWRTSWKHNGDRVHPITR